MKVKLLEKFGVQIVPATLADLAKWTPEILKDKGQELGEYIKDIKARVCINEIDQKSLEKLAALKMAMERWALSEKLSAIAIQCWDSLQDIMGIMPCFANAELTDAGIPVVCETTSRRYNCGYAAAAAETRYFRRCDHKTSENDNAELWHCGPFRTRKR